jgi:hypothetical protein
MAAVALLVLALLIILVESVEEPSVGGPENEFISQAKRAKKIHNVERKKVNTTSTKGHKGKIKFVPYEVDFKQLHATKNQSLVEVLERLDVFVYFITGQKRLKHLSHFVEQLGLGERFEFVPYFDKRILANNATARKIYVEEGIISQRMMTRANFGAIGCGLSHIKILRKFLTSDHKIAVIFEDDVIPGAAYQMPHDFNTARTALMQQLEVPAREWNLQHLGFCYEYCDGSVDGGTMDRMGTRCYTLEREAAGRGEIFTRSVKPLCTHALAFDRAAASVIAGPAHKLTENYDGQIVNAACAYSLRMIRPHRPIFDQVCVRIIKKAPLIPP